MACRLIGKPKFEVIKNSFFTYLYICFLKDLGDPRHLVIGDWLIYDNDRVIDIASFNKVIGNQ